MFARICGVKFVFKVGFQIFRIGFFVVLVFLLGLRCRLVSVYGGGVLVFLGGVVRCRI